MVLGNEPVYEKKKYNLNAVMFAKFPRETLFTDYLYTPMFRATCAATNRSG